MFDIEQTVITPIGSIPVRVTSRPGTEGKLGARGRLTLNNPGQVRQSGESAAGSSYEERCRAKAYQES
jgi:hypothetical protein